MADTLGSVGVIISTLLINRYGWTGFDPIASIFIAVLIFASVVPLVVDSAQVLCLELSDDHETQVRSALADVRSRLRCPTDAAARRRRGCLVVRLATLLAQGRQLDRRLDPHPARALAVVARSQSTPRLVVGRALRSH